MLSNLLKIMFPTWEKPMDMVLDIHPATAEMAREVAAMFGSSYAAMLPYCNGKHDGYWCLVALDKAAEKLRGAAYGQIHRHEEECGCIDGVLIIESLAIDQENVAQVFSALVISAKTLAADEEIDLVTALAMPVEVDGHKWKDMYQDHGFLTTGRHQNACAQVMWENSDQHTGAWVIERLLAGRSTKMFQV